MKAFLFGLFGAVAGYVVVAIISYWLILNLSSNTHDRSTEAVMSGAFVFGPIGAVIGFLIGYFLTRN